MVVSDALYETKLISKKGFPVPLLKYYVIDNGFVTDEWLLHHPRQIRERIIIEVCKLTRLFCRRQWQSSFLVKMVLLPFYLVLSQFPTSCQFLRSLKASKRFFPNFATHLICFVSIWYAAAWQVTATTWYFVDWRGHFL